MNLLAFDLARLRGTVGGSPSSPPTIKRLDLQSQELLTLDSAAGDARTWLLRRLRWERRFIELRAKYERSRT
jgi:hypothetical protein